MSYLKKLLTIPHQSLKKTNKIVNQNVVLVNHGTKLTKDLESQNVKKLLVCDDCRHTICSNCCIFQFLGENHFPVSCKWCYETGKIMKKVISHEKLQEKVNQQIANYEKIRALTFIKKIGEGLEGNVFLYHQKNGTEEFAVKVTHDKSSDYLPTFIEHCEKIMELQELEKEHIVPYLFTAIQEISHNLTTTCAPNQYDEQNQDDCESLQSQKTYKCYMVMPFYKEGTLRYLLSHRQHSDQEIPIHELNILHYASQLSKAIKILHSHGVLHRDLKPDNIFVERIENDLNLRIGDFGMMKAASEAKTVLGTPGYYAPEVALMKHYNFSADIFSFGCILFQLLVPKVSIVVPWGDLLGKREKKAQKLMKFHMQKV